MARIHLHPEHHLVDRIGWLRAAVLGANDGILSTASLIVGVAAAAATKNAVLVAGVAGLVAGATSLARKVAQQLMAKDALTGSCTRRARDFGNHHRAPRAGRIDVGFDIFDRRGFAFAYG